MGTYFPIFINLEGKKVQVFGGGNIAARRVSALLEFGAEVHVTAPEISRKLEELAKQKGNLKLHYRPYQPGELANAGLKIAAADGGAGNSREGWECRKAALAIAATNDETVNDMVYQECRKEGIPVNVASDKEKCDFFFPGIAKEGDITVGVTAGGKDHKKAAQVTAQIRGFLGGLACPAGGKDE